MAIDEDLIDQKSRTDPKDPSGRISTGTSNGSSTGPSTSGLDLPPSPIDEESQIQKNISEELEAAEKKASDFITSEDNRLNWHNSRKTIEDFRPVPWYIWRIVNFVLSHPGTVRPYDHGMVFALKRLLVLAARDTDIVKDGHRIKNAEAAVKVLPPDVFAACAVIHGVARRLKNYQFERLWQPILEEALLRTRIGFAIGAKIPTFGAGRGMLAGFAGRAGLAIQIATGSMEQAHETINRIAEGYTIQRIGHEIYQAEPLQVSAMMLIACGCGRDAAYGVMAVAALDLFTKDDLNPEQQKWRAVLMLLEKIRAVNLSELSDDDWREVGCTSKKVITELRADVRQVIRRGHSWGWLIE